MDSKKVSFKAPKPSSDTIDMLEAYLGHNGEAKVDEYFRHRTRATENGMLNYFEGKYLVGRETSLKRDRGKLSSPRGRETRGKRAGRVRCKGERGHAEVSLPASGS